MLRILGIIPDTYTMIDQHLLNNKAVQDKTIKHKHNNNSIKMLNIRDNNSRTFSNKLNKMHSKIEPD